MDKLFVIAIGGTGMRCLESFVHLCAIGMFDNEEIEILTLDTDQTNGNKGRVEQLIELYNRIKSNDMANLDGGQPNVDTFFSAKLNLYKFYTDYTDHSRKTYKLLSAMQNATDEQNKDNQDLSDLFLDANSVQSFDLDHGYRAQTHLGSMLMYHGIIEAAVNYAKDKSSAATQEVELIDFLNLLAQAGENARVFVFGSVFGGTGASSIPVIPTALKEAVSISSTNTLDLSRVKFGSTLLTEYFTFAAPDDTQKTKEHIVADANNFAMNSQAALQFYQDDPTVKSVYRKLYHVGWPLQSVNVSDGTTTTITGGAEQKNACHVAELMCACAAYDFFTLSDGDLADSAKEAEYLYRSIPFSGNSFDFTGDDFVGSKGNVFMNKLGAMLSLAHIILVKHSAVRGMSGTKGMLERFSKQKIDAYDSLTDQQAKEIDEYFKRFAYDINKAGRFMPGWIYQVRSSVGSGAFMFKSEAFPDGASLKNVDPGDIFVDEKHKWDKTLLGDRYNNFIEKTVTDRLCLPKEKQKVNTVKEKFLAHIYNGITIAQKFNL